MATENKVHFGLNKLYYAKILSYDENNMPVYDTPVRLPGAVSLSLDAEGDNSNFYADNIVYYVLANNSGYSGDLEVALVTEAFRHDILGEGYDDDGNLVENSGSQIAEFALMFEFDGDKSHIRHCLYRCTASRPGVEGSTIEDEKEVQTETLSLTVSALENGVVKKKTSTKTSAEAYNDWYKRVVLPTIKPDIVTFSPSSNTAIKNIVKSSGGTEANTTSTAPGYTSIYLSCSTAGAKIMYRVTDAGSTTTNPKYDEYTGPFRIASPAGVTSVSVTAYAVTTDSAGVETKGEYATANYSVNQTSAKENNFSEDEE